jgi:hypothetical protein
MDAQRLDTALKEAFHHLMECVIQDFSVQKIQQSQLKQCVMPAVIAMLDQLRSKVALLEDTTQILEEETYMHAPSVIQENLALVHQQRPQQEDAMKGFIAQEDRKLLKRRHVCLATFARQIRQHPLPVM